MGGTKRVYDSLTFRRGRSTLAAACLLAAIFLCAGVPAFSVARGTPLPGSPVVLPSAPLPQPLNPTLPTASVTCNSNFDCNDNNACTVDICINQTCQNNALPGCVPCTEGQPCPPVDLVVVMDTSGSMKDEAAALCASLASVIDIITTDGINISATILGVTETPGGAFECLDSHVVALLGASIPGNATSCQFPNGPFADESWGPGATIVADRFNWRPGAIRVVTPIGDEAPCNGSFPGGCQDPGEDRNSLNNLIAIALQNDVVLSPILGLGTDPCVAAMAQEAASATGGALFQSTTPSKDIAQAILQLVGDACSNAGECDDANACTNNDFCDAGVCTGEPIPGCTTCTTDTDCNDGLNCTLDRCLAGVCTHQDLNTIPCTSDADCFGAGCNTSTGFCACLQSTALCLNNLNGTLPGDGCYAENEIITINVEVGPTIAVLAGGQFAIDYDPSVLRFLSAQPGSVFDPSSVFSVEIYESVDQIAGRIFYAVGIDLLGGGAPGPAVMATLKFRPLGTCREDELCLVNDNPQNTLLTDIYGNSIPYEPCCTGPITIDAGPPQFLNCPASRSVNVQPGEVTAVVTWPTILVADNCEGVLPRFCSGVHSGGLPVDHLIANGGVFPIGVTTFNCAAVDGCELAASCTWIVEVTNNTLLDVDVQLSPTMAPGPLSRCITFELYASCSEPSVVVETMLDFGMPFNLPGRARRLGLAVPAGAYQCITARDEKHTLRSTGNLTLVSGNRYAASFVGDPWFGGDWLTGGNLDDNGAIDVIDFGFFLVDFLSQTTANTPCNAPGIHADVNGDGLVDQIDGMFIVSNFGRTAPAGCCPEGPAGVPDAMTEVSFNELDGMGLSRLRAADLNRDGRLNYADLEAFTAGQTPKPKPGRPRK